MLTRREFLAASTAGGAVAAMHSGALAQTSAKHSRTRDAIPPTSPTPVSARPSEHPGGTTVNVGSSPGDLQTQINLAINADGTHKGNTLVCPAGVTYDPITLPPTTGPGWTCIRSGSGALPARGVRVVPTNANTMFKVRSLGGSATNPSASAVAVRVPTHGWRFIGMEATHSNASDQYAVVSLEGDTSSRLSFERCYIHPFDGKQANSARGIWAAGVNELQVWDSWIEGRCIVNGLTDAQAIALRRGSRTHIENNLLQGTTENVLLGDQNSGGPCVDVTIKRNHLFKPLTWSQFLLTDGTTPNPTWDGVHWLVKNCFEIKWATRMLFEGNVCENTWPPGQPGDILVFNGGRQPSGLDAIGTDCMIRSNKFLNGTNGFTVNMNVPGGVPNLRCAIVNNLFLGIRGRAWNFGHAGIDIWVEHNTIVPVTGTGSNFSSFTNYIAPDTPSSFPRLTIKRNVFGHSRYGVTVPPDGAGTPTRRVWDLMLPDRSFAENAEFGASGSYPDGITMYASAAAAGLNTSTGELNARSPLLKSGSDGKALGVDFAELSAALTGTADRGA